MNKLDLQLNSDIFDQLNFYCRVLSLFDNTETITEMEIENKVKFYSLKSEEALKKMSNQATNK